MAWKIGDHGFEMVLSNAIPAIIDDHITGALEPLFATRAALAAALAADTASEAIEHWAIHPGGRSILDKVESRLVLTEAQLVPARETLHDFGNMSSATVLFVLQAHPRVGGGRRRRPGRRDGVRAGAHGRDRRC